MAVLRPEIKAALDLASRFSLGSLSLNDLKAVSARNPRPLDVFTNDLIAQWLMNKSVGEPRYLNGNYSATQAAKELQVMLNNWLLKTG